MGTEVNPFDIFKGSLNNARSSFRSGKMQGERLDGILGRTGRSVDDYAEKKPRTASAIAGVFFLLLGFLIWKLGKGNVEGAEYSIWVFGGLSAFAWIRFWWLGRKKNKHLQEDCNEMEEYEFSKSIAKKTLSKQTVKKKNSISRITNGSIPPIMKYTETAYRGESYEEWRERIKEMGVAPDIREAMNSFFSISTTNWLRD